ncbi:DUF359 domain-containing protein [Oxyplasma meridianum]|uniref:GTP-dependent dephospho-CoA kinase n=1 Tax=Oxyplasma meridianum TaxID=3073602 RepID=A0AAX4NFS9_9ARCH
MQLKSGSKFIVSHIIREEISQSNGEFCSPEIVLNRYSGRTICSVGDVTTKILSSASVEVFLQVVDLKTKRNNDGSFPHIEGSIKVFNPPGVITHDLFLAIEKVFKEGKKARIEVDGEEDLAVIPIIFYSKLDTVIAYGIPDKGMACLEVTQSLKEKIDDLLKRMDIEWQK